MGLMKCPDCGREISENTKQCPYCGSPFENENLMSCPSCGHSVSKKANACPNCGHPLQEKQTIRVTFSKISLFNRGCKICEENGYTIASCEQGDTVEIKSGKDLNVIIVVNANGSLKTCLKVGRKYQVKGGFWKPKIVEDIYDVNT